MMDDELIQVNVSSRGSEMDDAGGERGSKVSEGRLWILVQCGALANFSRWVVEYGVKRLLRLKGAIWLLM